MSKELKQLKCTRCNKENFTYTGIWFKHSRYQNKGLNYLIKCANCKKRFGVSQKLLSILAKQEIKDKEFIKSVEEEFKEH